MEFDETKSYLIPQLISAENTSIQEFYDKVKKSERFKNFIFQNYFKKENLKIEIFTIILILVLACIIFIIFTTRVDNGIDKNLIILIFLFIVFTRITFKHISKRFKISEENSIYFFKYFYFTIFYICLIVIYFSLHTRFVKLDKNLFFFNGVGFTINSQSNSYYNNNDSALKDAFKLPIYQPVENFGLFFIYLNSYNIQIINSHIENNENSKIDKILNLTDIIFINDLNTLHNKLENSTMINNPKNTSAIDDNVYVICKYRNIQEYNLFATPYFYNYFFCILFGINILIFKLIKWKVILSMFIANFLFKITILKYYEYNDVSLMILRHTLFTWLIYALVYCLNKANVGNQRSKFIQNLFLNNQNSFTKIINQKSIIFHNNVKNYNNQILYNTFNDNSNSKITLKKELANEINIKNCLNKNSYSNENLNKVYRNNSLNFSVNKNISKNENILTKKLTNIPIIQRNYTIEIIREEKKEEEISSNDLAIKLDLKKENFDKNDKKHLFLENGIKQNLQDSEFPNPFSKSNNKISKTTEFFQDIDKFGKYLGTEFNEKQKRNFKIGKNKKLTQIPVKSMKLDLNGISNSSRVNSDNNIDSLYKEENNEDNYKKNIILKNFKEKYINNIEYLKLFVEFDMENFDLEIEKNDNFDYLFRNSFENLDLKKSI